MKAFQLIAFLIVLMPAFAWAERTLVWNKSPLTIILPVGEEIRVTFPTDVTLQLPAETTQKLESLAPNQRIVYWKATSEFNTSRAIATSLDNESVYLIDLIAQPNAVSESLLIEDPDRVVLQRADTESETVTSTGQQELLDPPEIVLTRFASQSLYAPRRLLPVNGDIHSYAVPAIPPDFPLMRSQSGEQYHFLIVGAWSGYNRYLTAIMVTNKSALPIHVNPALISGNFTHATAQHLTLGPSGSIEDRTTLYLISDSPFATAVMEDGYGY